MKSNIPSDWDNETWASFCIEWPDSDHWRAILAGLINMPSRGRNWTNDSGTVKDAQAIGEEIWSRFLEQTGCEGGNMDVRQNPENPCHLDKDPGTGWEQFADLSLCGAQMFEDPPYTGPEFETSEDNCLMAVRVAERMYDRLLELAEARGDSSSESEMFFNIIATMSGYIFFPNMAEIYNLAGALYQCTEGGMVAAFGTDMRDDLICALLASAEETEGQGDFTRYAAMRDAAAAWAAGYTFAGDESLAVKQVVLYYCAACHSADFMYWYYLSEVETWNCVACTGEWCYEFDFTADDGDFAASTYPCDTRGYGSYSSGVGWVGEPLGTVGQPGSGNFVYITRAFSRRITHVEFDLTIAEVPNSEYAEISQPVSGDCNITLNHVHDMAQGTNTIEWDGDEEVTGIWIGAAVGYRPKTIAITRLLIRGYGTNPFGEDNCT